MSVNFESGFNATLAQALKSDGSETSITLAAVPITVTSGVMRIGSGDNVEWDSFTGVSGSTITGVTRGIDRDATSITDATAANKKNFAVGTPVKLVAHSLDLNLKANLDTNNVHTAGKTSFTSTTAMQFKNQSLTTTERDALTGVENAGQIYNETDGQTQWREGGSWVSNAAGGSVPNASTTVAGKGEIADDTEVDTADDIGATGAPTLMIPSQTARVIQKSQYTFAVTTGTAAAYVLTLAPVQVAYTDGMVIRFRPSLNNSASVTINVNGLGAVFLLKNVGAVLEPNDLVTAGNYEFQFSSSSGSFVMQNPVANTMSSANSDSLVTHLSAINTVWVSAGEAVKGSSVTEDAENTPTGIIVFPDATDQSTNTANFTAVVPKGATSITSIKVSYISVNTNNLFLKFEGSSYLRTSGALENDQTDTLTTYAGDNASSEIGQITVPSGAFNSITVAQDRIFSIRVIRDADDASDTYNAEWRVTGVEIVFA